MAFLACNGGSGDTSKSVEQMEHMLRSANAQNKVLFQSSESQSRFSSYKSSASVSSLIQELLKKIEDAENKLRLQSQPFLPIEDSKKWMQAMLAQKQ